MAIAFKIPTDYSAPEGVKEGKEFNDLATFKIDGGKIMVLAIGQDKIPLMSREEKEEKLKGGKDAIKEKLRALEKEAMMEEEGMNQEMEEEDMEEDEMEEEED